MNNFGKQQTIAINYDAEIQHLTQSQHSSS